MISLRRALPLVAFLGAAPSTATEPLRQPTGKWVVDYGETYCTASRAYGTPERPLTLGFRPALQGSVVRLVLVRAGRVATPHHFPVSINAAASGRETTGLRFTSDNRKLDAVWINLDPALLESVRRMKEVAIKGGTGGNALFGFSKVDERFALPGIDAVLKALATCNENLRKHWNAGEGAAAQLSQPATLLTPPRELLRNTDYPSQALRELKSGRIKVTLLVDENGAAKDCMIEETSGVATLDAMGCGRLQQRARFKPALDASGKPARSVYATGIAFIIPK